MVLVILEEVQKDIESKFKAVGRSIAATAMAWPNFPTIYSK